MKTAVLGYGVVGRGVWEMLCAAPGLEPGPVLVRPGKERESFMLSSMEAILADESVEAVAEVMGGVDAPYRCVRQAILAGRHVVSSNKALIAAHGPELAALAAERGVALLFSAACGGAIPFLHNLSLAAQSDRIESLGGILNGTTNFMLDAMQSGGGDYEDALREAQRLGYAEADPTADVSGLDSLRKIVLACAAAWGLLPDRGLVWEGIQSLRREDLRHIRAKGLVCRLLGQGGKMANGRIYAFVQPALLPETAPEAAVKSNFNLARYRGANCGELLLMGQGAGRYPTASAVLRDLNDIQAGRRSMIPADTKRTEADNESVLRRYYLRLPGAFARLFPLEEQEREGELVRAMSAPLPVAEMQRRAESIRAMGEEIFFAAMEEG